MAVTITILAITRVATIKTNKVVVVAEMLTKVVAVTEVITNKVVAKTTRILIDVVVTTAEVAVAIKIRIDIHLVVVTIKEDMVVEATTMEAVATIKTIINKEDIVATLTVAVAEVDTIIMTIEDRTIIIMVNVVEAERWEIEIMTEEDKKEAIIDHLKIILVDIMEAVTMEITETTAMDMDTTTITITPPTIKCRTSTIITRDSINRKERIWKLSTSESSTIGLRAFSSRNMVKSSVTWSKLKTKMSNYLKITCTS